MTHSRINTFAKLLKGLITSVLVTLLLMLLLAIAAVSLKLSDTSITWLNQFIKIISIFLGVWVTVGRGGENGFIKGLVLAIIYIILGYFMYVILGGNAFSAVTMLGEILIGAAVGSIAGAILANLSPKHRRKKH